MADVLVGIMLGALALVLCFAGLRVFFLALPILGFIAGFFVGAAGVRAIFGDGFLSTVTGVIIGFFVGLLFAVISYLLWYVGALISAGSTGALLGSGLMSLFNVDTGWLVFIVAATLAVVAVIIAIVLALPIWIVLFNTAMVGALGIIGGILLIFNQIDRSDLGYGVAWATIQESWFWLIAWIALAGLGIAVQIQSIASTRLPEDRFTKAI